MGRLIDIESYTSNYSNVAIIYDDGNHIKQDYVSILPTVEAIPKADYENRLKADLVTMLTELQLEIEKLDTPNNGSAYMDCAEIIQEKINSLRG